MAHKLLLADDSITIQKVVELVLAEEDFEIKSVGNGEDALNAVGSFNPDIVLADIDMPRMNGYQLCDKIKKNPKTAGVTVILLAGAFEPIDEDLATEVRADDSIVKPFESQELISKINSALTISSAEGPQEIPLGEEEAITLMEEAGEAAGADDAIEVLGAEEDLWAMESSEDDMEEMAVEAIDENERVEVEEAFEIPEETLETEPFTVAPEPAAQPRARKEVEIRDTAMPSRDEMLRIFERAVQERVNSVLSSPEIKDALLSSLVPTMKDSLERILWEVAPDLTEKMLKEALKGSIPSISGQIEKVIWETVPDLAGTMISKEIEKIKSEF
jgi:DNA-binding response OmpR family regulator